MPSALQPRLKPSLETDESIMNTTLRFLNLNIHGSWHGMIEQQVAYWHSLTAVTATELLLERQHNGRAAFRVQVRLEVSGGNLHAEAVARTLKLALIGASRDLEHQIQNHQNQRVERRAHQRELAAGAGSPSYP
jgi:ribosome-associated translation inhibitor RaiA